MLNDKMNALIEEVCGELAEREELVHTIALALLTRKTCLYSANPARRNPRPSTCSAPISRTPNNSTSS